MIVIYACEFLVPLFCSFERTKSIALVHRLISGRHTVGFKRVWMLVSCPRNSRHIAAIKMGRRHRHRREEGAYLNRYVTDEQRRCRPIFIATLRAGASWLFFHVARSTRMTQIWVLRSPP